MTTMATIPLLYSRFVTVYTSSRIGQIDYHVGAGSRRQKEAQRLVLARVSFSPQLASPAVTTSPGHQWRNILDNDNHSHSQLPTHH